MFLPIEYLQQLKTQSFSSLKVLAPFFLFVNGWPIYFNNSIEKKHTNKQTQTNKTIEILEYKRNKKKK